MIEKSIGERIKYLRKKKKITQQQMAEKLDISVNHMSAFERGKYNIKLELLVIIMNELECTADDIFCDVIKCGYKNKASRLSDKIEKLPTEEQEKIFEVVETLLKVAKK